MGFYWVIEVIFAQHRKGFRITQQDKLDLIPDGVRRGKDLTGHVASEGDQRAGHT